MITDELKDYTSICAGTPNECLGLIALRAREALWARCNDIVATNLILMDQFAQGREVILRSFLYSL